MPIHFFDLLDSWYTKRLERCVLLARSRVGTIPNAFADQHARMLSTPPTPYHGSALRLTPDKKTLPSRTRDRVRCLVTVLLVAKAKSSSSFHTFKLRTWASLKAHQ